MNKTIESQSALSAKEKVNVLRTQIVSMLDVKAFVSGEYISEKLNITRSSVSNHIKALGELGVDIYSVKGRGYKLAQPLYLLHESKIREHLNLASKTTPPSILVHNVVGSTNDVIKTNSDSLMQGSVCLAEAQTQGRGRRGRKWVSPFGASIYMSMLWRFESGYQSMAGLSLLIGIGLNRALKRIGIESCQLKWPNDVYHDSKKLAGILIEVEGQVGEQTTAIIGIGVNMQLPNTLTDIDQPFTDVSSILNSPSERNLFSAYLIDELWQMLPVFQLEGLTPFMQQWRDADLYYNKAVSLVSGSYVVKGISRGIDSSGALLLEVEGKIKPYHGGEISVRPI